jgi:hypothetical protein
LKAAVRYSKRLGGESEPGPLEKSLAETNESAGVRTLDP